MCVWSVFTDQVFFISNLPLLQVAASAAAQVVENIKPQEPKIGSMTEKVENRGRNEAD